MTDTTWSTEAEAELRRILADLRRENAVLRGIIHLNWKRIRKLKQALKQVGG
jgi:hypothetical protein